jgi:hypothetical protein
LLEADELTGELLVTSTSGINISQVTGDLSTNNSSTTVLDAGAVFTGTSDEVINYKSIGINVIASHASATNGLTFQFSSDGTNWDKIHTFTLAAATAKFFNVPVESRYFRIVYTNGSTLQTYFRLQTIYHATMTKESTLRLGDAIDAETAAQLSRAVISGLEASSGLFKNVSTFDTGTVNSMITSLVDVSGNRATILASGADATGNGVDELVTASLGYVFNGTTWDRARGDLTNGLLVNLGANNDVVIGHGITGMADGVKTVTTAGTDEALAGSTACKKVDIQAQTDNTGLIAVGGSGVDATEATGTGIILYAGGTYSLEIDNLADIYIDATVSGEGVRYVYYT